MYKDSKWYPEEITSDSVIFLDIDGVLNGRGTKERLYRYIFVEPCKIEVLRQVAEQSGSQIVLSSSWRIDCVRGDAGFMSSDRNIFIPLIAELSKYGVEIADITTDQWLGRGREIWDFCLSHPQIKHCLILDDDTDMSLMYPYQFHTSYEDVEALDEEDVDTPYGIYPEAIPTMLEMLKRPFVCPEYRPAYEMQHEDEYIAVGSGYLYGDLGEAWRLAEETDWWKEMMEEEVNHNFLKGRTHIYR